MHDITFHLMRRRAMPWVVASLLAALGSAPAMGQRTASARLTAARAALHSLKLDSAALLLRDLLRSADDIPREDRVDAWLLLGVVQFYQGSDSGTAVDFREALILQPGIRADGLATYDAALVTLTSSTSSTTWTRVDSAVRRRQHRTSGTWYRRRRLEHAQDERAGARDPPGVPPRPIHAGPGRRAGGLGHGAVHAPLRGRAS